MVDSAVFWNNCDEKAFEAKIQINSNGHRARIHVRTYCDTATVYDISEEKLRELRDAINTVLGEK